MTETELDAPKNTEPDSRDYTATDSEIVESARNESYHGEVRREEPAVNQLSSAGRNGRGGGGNVTALLLAFVAGLLIGYIARPFTDQLAAGDQAEAVALNEPVATDEPEPTDAQPQPAADAEEPIATTGDEAPMLITPTPDRSEAIAALIEQNTRHFIGDEDAPVTLIEFSDFM